MPPHQDLPEFAKGLSTPVPRPVRMTAGLVWRLQFCGGICALIFALPVTLSSSDLLKYQVLLARGQSGLAQIERFYDTSSKSRTITHHVDYSYVVDGVRHEEKDFISDADYPRYKAGQDVPILFNPNRFAWSIVAPDGRATLQARNERALGVVKFFACLAAGAAVLLGALQLRTYRQERRLLKWGEPTWVKIVSTQPYSVKSRDYMRALYQFDRANVTYSGRSNIALEDWFRIQTMPVALYDPANPARSNLYPFSSVELCK